MDWTNRHEPLAISGWVTVEFRGALALKARLGKLDESARRDALQAYFQAARDEFLMLGITDEIFREAAKMAGNVEVGLRAGDALHLAVAAGHGATLVTRDRRQAEAGAAFGIGAVVL